MTTQDEAGRTQQVTLGVRDWIKLAGLSIAPAVAFGSFLLSMTIDVSILKKDVSDLKDVGKQQATAITLLSNTQISIREIERRLDRIEDEKGRH